MINWKKYFNFRRKGTHKVTGKKELNIVIEDKCTCENRKDCLECKELEAGEDLQFYFDENKQYAPEEHTKDNIMHMPGMHHLQKSYENLGEEDLEEIIEKVYSEFNRKSPSERKLVIGRTCIKRGFIMDDGSYLHCGDSMCQPCNSIWAAVDKQLKEEVNKLNLNKSNMKPIRIGAATQALKQGKRVRRSCWGEGTFIFRQVPSAIDAEIIPKMTSLPDTVKAEFKRRQEGLPEEQQGDYGIRYANQIALVNKNSLIGAYTFQNQDVLAEDWEILD